jgi:hypothetical protein
MECTARGFRWPRTFASTCGTGVACERKHKSYGDLGISGKDKETMSNEEVTVGYKGWMLVWACVAVFAVLCVAAVVWN